VHVSVDCLPVGFQHVSRIYGVDTAISPLFEVRCSVHDLDSNCLLITIMALYTYASVDVSWSHLVHLWVGRCVIRHPLSLDFGGLRLSLSLGLSCSTCFISIRLPHLIAHLTLSFLWLALILDLFCVSTCFRFDPLTSYRHFGLCLVWCRCLRLWALAVTRSACRDFSRWAYHLLDARCVSWFFFRYTYSRCGCCWTSLLLRALWSFIPAPLVGSSLSFNIVALPTTYRL